MGTKGRFCMSIFFIALVFLAGCAKKKKELPRYKRQKAETIIRYDDRHLAKMKMKSDNP